MPETHGKVVLLQEQDYKVVAEMVRWWRSGGQLPRQYPDEPMLGGAGGAKLYRFQLKEDATGGDAEDEYEADIYQPDKVLYREEQVLVDTDGMAASMQLVAEDWGICWRYKGKYYYLNSGCGSGSACSAGPLVPKQTPTTAELLTPYSWTPTHTGTAPTLWAATGLPAGLAIDGSTGAVTGTPTGPAGSSKVILTATAGECTATRVVTITVDPP